MQDIRFDIGSNILIYSENGNLIVDVSVELT